MYSHSKSSVQPQDTMIGAGFGGTGYDNFRGDGMAGRGVFIEMNGEGRYSDRGGEDEERGTERQEINARELGG